MGYAVRITSHAVDVVTGADKTAGIVAAEASGAGRKKWGGGELRSRAGRTGGAWTPEGGSPYGSYAGTPTTGFAQLGSPYLSSPYGGNGATTPGAQAQGAGYGLGLSSPSFGPAGSPRIPHSAPGNFPTAATVGSPYSPYAPPPTSPPTTAGLYAHFPPTPNPPHGANGDGFPSSPAPASTFSAQQGSAPPRRENGTRHSSHGSLGATKKDD